MLISSSGDPNKFKYANDMVISSALEVNIAALPATFWKYPPLLITVAPFTNMV